MPRAILFDLDGTLWHSYPWYAQLLADLSGNSHDELLTRLVSGGNVIELAKDLGAYSQFKTVANNRAASLQLYRGVPDVLQKLQFQGISLGVVTNLPAWLASPLLNEKQISGFFEAVVTWRHGRNKPNPKGICKVLEELNVTNRERRSVWYVGDMQTDARAALDAGVRFAWASYGYGGQAQPKGATAVIGDFREILNL